MEKSVENSRFCNYHIGDATMHVDGDSTPKKKRPLDPNADFRPFCLSIIHFGLGRNTELRRAHYPKNNYTLYKYLWTAMSTGSHPERK
jgi:hypothetical protein